jgi:RNA polymerase sigma-70 factor, ECF subfamily
MNDLNDIISCMSNEIQSSEADQMGQAGLAFSDDDRKYAYAVARRIVRDDHDAQDVAQDALMLAYRHRDGFRGQSKSRTWFHRIVTTTALSHLRSSLRRRRYLEQIEAQPNAAISTPEQALSRREIEHQVAAHVDQLPAKYREVLALRIDDLTDVEISRRLNITVASVKVRCHRARHQLRAALCVDFIHDDPVDGGGASSHAHDLEEAAA